MKSLVRLIGTMAFALGMAGAAFAAQVELKFLNWSSTEEIYKPIFKVIEDFERANPDIKIKNMPIGVGEIRNQFMVMTLGGNAPDVVQLHIGDAVTMLTMGAIIPAEELYPKAFIDQLNPVFFKEALWGDKHAGVVWGPNTMTFFVNRKLLKQLGFSAPPKTLDEMEAMMKKGKETIPDLVGLQLDTTIRTIGFTHQWAFMNAFEYEPIKGTTVKFNTPGMVQYGEWIRRTVKNGYTLPGKRFGEFPARWRRRAACCCYDGSGHRGQIEAFDKALTAEYGVSTSSGRAVPLRDRPEWQDLRHRRPCAGDRQDRRARRRRRSSSQYLTDSRSTLGPVPRPGRVPAAHRLRRSSPARSRTKAARQPRYAGAQRRRPAVRPDYVKVGTLVMTAVQEIVTTDKTVKGILDTYQLELEGAVQ